MAIDLETLQATLRLESAQWRAGMAQAKADISGLKTTLADFGKRTADIGKTLTTRVTAPIVGLGVAAVKFATDQAESLNKVNEVYGDNAKVIEDWSKGSAQAFGLSQAESLEAAGTLGNLFKGVGVANDELPKMSQNLIGAAADLGSFNNASPAQVFEDINSGLVGQSEPLRKYGILLNETTVGQKAMAMTGKENVKQLTEGEKVAARYELIMEQVGDAQGDFARTSDGLANKTRILKAQMKDLGAQFGAIMLPLVTRLANAFGRLMERFAGLSTRTKTIILVIAGIAAALGPLLIIIGQVAIGLSALAPAFALLLGPIGLLILVLGLLTAAYLTNFLGFGDLVDNIMGSKAIGRFVKSLKKMLDGIIDIGKALKKGDFGAAFDGLKKAAAGLGDFLAAPAKMIGELLSKITTGIAPIDRLLRLVGRTMIDFGRIIQEVFQGDFRGALEVGERMLRRFATQIPLILAEVWQAIRAGFAAIDWGAVFSTLLTAALVLGSALVSAGADLIRGLWNGAVDFLTNTVLPWLGELGVKALAAVPDLLSTLLEKGKQLATGLLDGAKQAWFAVELWFGTLAQGVVSLVPDLLSTLLQKGKDLITGIWTGITSEWGPKVGFWLSNLGMTIIGAVPDLLSTLLQKGKDLLTGLYTGITSGWGLTVGFWLTNLAMTILGAVPDLLATLLQKGVDLLQGLMDGITSKWPEIDTWLMNLATDAFETVGSLASTLLSRGIELLQGLFDGITQKWPEIDSWLLGIAGDIVATVGDLSGILYSAGFDAIQGLINGVMDKIPGLQAAVDLAKAIFNQIPGLGDSPWPMMIGAGRDAMDGLIIGWSSRQRQLEAAIGRTIAATAFSAAPSALSAFAGASATGMGARGDTHIAFHPGAIVVNGAADPAAVADSVADAVFRKFSREMVLAGGVS